MIPLFNIFPRLKERIPFFPIGGYPSSIQHLGGLSRQCGSNHLYIKRDDLSGTLYGGNKVRKLEFLLGDALAHNFKHVITSGGAGSNHARATATYASVAKLQCSLMLFDQPPSLYVKENLLADFKFSARMYLDPTYEEHTRHLKAMIQSITEQESSPPYIIPPGGSSPVGTIGFVNAGFELATQIKQGELPVPDAIFITLGTMGTAAGLILGLKAAGITTMVHAVRVVPDYVGNFDKCIILAEQTNKLLHDLDTSFPVLNISEKEITVHSDYFGNGYGIPTREGEKFIQAIRKSDAIELDSIYTGKCGAAFF
ncbi:MAG TPA: pyridoxal-phosphate dependent enzyme [Chitinispirillaceae bacterium]|nr:pyridoxal-phosphate dependent enzyme [Chitinispirillaceae bacterium]